MPLCLPRISDVAWTGLLAFAMTVMAGGLWTALLVINLATSQNVPWAILAMGVLLWMIWQYLGGHWGPRSTSQARCARRRPRSISPAVFTAALLAGGLAIVALAEFWMVAFQLAQWRGTCFQTFPIPARHGCARTGDGLTGRRCRRRGRFSRVFSEHA